eukprot:6070657-Pleurochrysis_carterae.AAC.1
MRTVVSKRHLVPSAASDWAEALRVQGDGFHAGARYSTVVMLGDQHYATASFGVEARRRHRCSSSDAARCLHRVGARRAAAFSDRTTSIRNAGPCVCVAPLPCGAGRERRDNGANGQRGAWTRCADASMSNVPGACAAWSVRMRAGLTPELCDWTRECGGGSDSYRTGAEHGLQHGPLSLAFVDSGFDSAEPSSRLSRAEDRRGRHFTADYLRTSCARYGNIVPGWRVHQKSIERLLRDAVCARASLLARQRRSSLYASNVSADINYPWRAIDFSDPSSKTVSSLSPPPPPPPSDSASEQLASAEDAANGRRLADAPKHADERAQPEGRMHALDEAAEGLEGAQAQARAALGEAGTGAGAAGAAAVSAWEAEQAA